jgi:hypothetical protein
MAVRDIAVQSAFATESGQIKPDAVKAALKTQLATVRYESEARAALRRVLRQC